MNPFKYGTVVEDKYFVNRTKELSRLKEELRNGSNIILYAPRRYGKTSLILEILNRLKQEGVKTVYLDLFQTYSVDSFIQLYASKIMEACGFSMKKTITSLKTSLRGILPSVGLDEGGKPVLNFSYDSRIPKEYSLLDVLDLPNKLRGKNEKWVIVFDEFQEIDRLDGETIEKQFRSILQLHQDIGYVLMGSKTHMMLSLFADKRRAFYNIGKIQKLEKIPAPEMRAYMESRFQSGGFTFEAAIFETILSYTDNIPYYNQYLAAQLWQLAQEGNRAITPDLVQQAVQQIIDNQSDYYFTLLDHLTIYQRQVLHAFLQQPVNIYTKEYSQTYNLSTVASLRRAMMRLVEIGIIEKIEETHTFSDPFFPLYLKQRRISY